MEDEIRRWTALRRPAPFLEIIQVRAKVVEAARLYELVPSEIEDWVDQAIAWAEIALRANPEDISEQYEPQLKTPQEAW